MKNVIACCLVVGFIFLASCEDKIVFKATETSNVENEAAVDGYFEEMDDLAVSVVSVEDGASNGSRESAARGIKKEKLDFRFDCKGTEVNTEFAADNTKDNPHGTITIDFGEEGCTDKQGNVRKGKILVEFKGRRFVPGSTIIMTSEGYSINNVMLEGTTTVTTIAGSTEDEPKFNVVSKDGMAAWPDSTFATREANLTRIAVRAKKPMDDEWRVTGTASGTNRNEDVYEMEITKPLVFKRECATRAKVFIATEGTKELTVNGKPITIDYGSGDCDRTVTITVEGQSKEVEVRGDF